MAEIYKRFAASFKNISFDEEAACDMYLHENGLPLPLRKQANGFQAGKRILNITIKMWREDIAKGLLSVQELLDDDYPEWFLKQTGMLKFKRIYLIKETK